MPITSRLRPMLDVRRAAFLAGIERILHELVELTQEFRAEISLSRLEAADMAGTTKETLIRTFRRLEMEGVILQSSRTKEDRRQGCGGTFASLGGGLRAMDREPETTKGKTVTRLEDTSGAWEAFLGEDDWASWMEEEERRERFTAPDPRS